MSTVCGPVVEYARKNPGPRWSVRSTGGTRALDPALITGLPPAGSMVWVGPPLLERAPRPRAAPIRLFPLVPDRVNPAVLPIALKLALTVVPLAPTPMSGEVPLVLFETIELASVTVLAVVLRRATPPPPVPLAVLPTIVVFSSLSDPPALVLMPMPPPVVAAVFPVMVLFWTTRPPVAVPLVQKIPPPAVVLEAFPEIVLLRITNALGVNPTGGAELGLVKK